MNLSKHICGICGMEGQRVFDVVRAVQEVLYVLFQGYCLQYFFGAFLESRFPKSKWSSVFVIILFGILKLGGNLLIPTGYESTVIIERQILLLFIVLVLAFGFYKAVHTITVFLVVTFMAVSEISFFLAYLLFQFGCNIFDILAWLVEKEYITSPRTVAIVSNTIVLILQLLLYVVCIMLLYFSLTKIVKSFREKDYSIHKTELLFILTPGMVGLLICMLLRIVMVTLENGVPELLYEKYPILIIFIPLIMLLSLLSILYGVKLFQDMIYVNREKNSRIILENQIGSMQEHMKEMERVYSGLRSMKHDMKNTLFIIMQLAEGKGEKENTELQAYVSELNHTFDRLEFQFKTGNTVVDTLLNMKYHEALRTIPDIQIDAECLLFPDNLLIQSYDIGIILGNALDNAIEACRKLKEKEPDAEAFIRLSSFQKGKMIFIEIENSFDGNVIRKRQSEFPVTDKADKQAHGIGLANVKKAAEKYHGAVDWSVDHKAFTLSVMMQNEGRVEHEY